MANMYTVKKTINEKEYVAQFSGLSVALKALDASYIDGTNNTSMEKMAQYLFDNIIVEPKGLSIDDFDNMEEFNEVIKFAREVMQGEFRDKKNENAAKGAGKK